jgi:hypothetical protein
MLFVNIPAIILNILNCYLFREIEWVGMDWIDLAQVRDQYRALVNTVMNFRFP